MKKSLQVGQGSCMLIIHANTFKLTWSSLGTALHWPYKLKEKKLSHITYGFKFSLFFREKKLNMKWCSVSLVCVFLYVSSSMGGKYSKMFSVRKGAFMSRYICFHCLQIAIKSAAFILCEQRLGSLHMCDDDVKTTTMNTIILIL